MEESNSRLSKAKLDAEKHMRLISENKLKIKENTIVSVAYILDQKNYIRYICKDMKLNAYHIFMINFLKDKFGEINESEVIIPLFKIGIIKHTVIYTLLLLLICAIVNLSILIYGHDQIVMLFFMPLIFMTWFIIIEILNFYKIKFYKID